MRVSIEAEDQGTTGRKVQIVLSKVGAEAWAWVRIEIDGQTYDVDYREFWNAARSVCIEHISQ